MLEEGTNTSVTGYRAKLLVVVSLVTEENRHISSFCLMSDGAICESCFLVVTNPVRLPDVPVTP